MTSHIINLASIWRKVSNELKDYRRCTFRKFRFVKVDCERFRGHGITIFQGEAPPDHVAVLLENGNTWWYPIESVVPVTNLRDVPRSVRRMKLRLRGYKLTGCRR